MGLLYYAAFSCKRKTGIAVNEAQPRLHSGNMHQSSRRLGSCITLVDTDALGRLPLKRTWRDIAESRVESNRVVIAHVLSEERTQRVVGGEGDAARQFGLERMKEGFRVCVVTRAAHIGTLQHAELRDPRTKRRAHVFDATITVKNDPVRALPTRRWREHRTRDVRGASARQRPREDASRILIHHDREIPPVDADAKIRNVADPHLIAARQRRLPQAIWMACVLM